MSEKLRVLIWNEGRHEQSSEAVQRVYPEGIHGALAAGLQGRGDFEIRTATLEDPEQGLSEAALAETDVMTWWGHIAHGEVAEEHVERVQQRVLEGMGLVVLHSGHLSKIFRRLMGTSCLLSWREAAEKERLWVTAPSHPIAAGLGEYFEVAEEEMYGEFFDIPAPEELVFVSWFQGGEVFRSGCCYQRGHGRVFYFRPGHETYPTYYEETVLQVIANALRWAAPQPAAVKRDLGRNVPPLEKLE